MNLHAVISRNSSQNTNKGFKSKTLRGGDRGDSEDKSGQLGRIGVRWNSNVHLMVGISQGSCGETKWNWN